MKMFHVSFGVLLLLLLLLVLLFIFYFFFCRYREEEQGSKIPLFSPLFLPLPFFSLFYNLKIMSKEVIANQ